MNPPVDESVSDIPLKSCESKELHHLGLVALAKAPYVALSCLPVNQKPADCRVLLGDV